MNGVANTGMSKKLTIGILIIQTIAHMAQEAPNKVWYALMVCGIGIVFTIAQVFKDVMLRDKDDKD